MQNAFILYLDWFWKEKRFFSPFIKKTLSSYNGKAVINMRRAFLFYSSLRRQAFFFHTAIRLAYQLFFPLNSLKISILVLEKKPHKSGEESHFSRFPPLRLISLFSAAIAFPRGFPSQNCRNISREVIACLSSQVTAGKGTLCGAQAQNGNGFVA